MAFDTYLIGKRISCFWEFRQQGDSVASKHCKRSTSRSEAEKDYIKRCSQHLKMVLPGHIQVPEDDLILLVNACDSNRLATEGQIKAAERASSLLSKPYRG